MEIEIRLDDLRKKSLFVTTPMYGGMNHGMYLNACLELQKLMLQYQIKVQFIAIYNESLITRARNYLVDSFLHRSDGSHLLFIDATSHFSRRTCWRCCAGSTPFDLDLDLRPPTTDLKAGS